MKATALRTQKRAQSIDYQCSVRNFERVAIIRGKAEIDSLSQDKDIVDGSAMNPSFFHQKTVGLTKRSQNRTGKSFVANLKISADGTYNFWFKFPKECQWTCELVTEKHMLDFLECADKSRDIGLKSCFTSKEKLTLSTERYFEFGLVHANPISKNPWNDWVCVKTPTCARLPCHIMAFIDIPPSDKKGTDTPQILDGTDPREGGEHCVMQHVPEDPFGDRDYLLLYGNNDHDCRLMENCQLLRWSFKVTPQLHSNKIPNRSSKNGRRPLLNLISVSSMKDPCCAISDPQKINKYPNTYVFLPPRNTWPDLFRNILSGVFLDAPLPTGEVFNPHDDQEDEDADLMFLDGDDMSEEEKEEVE